MQLLEAQQKLNELKIPIIQTADASACLKISRQHASQILSRLAKSKIIFPLKRGVFALTDQIDPLTIVEYLTAPFPAYVSLQTALYYHHVISQIPDIIYAVSTARTRKYESPLGVISVHHIESDFFDGFEIVGKNALKIATVEKALIDTLYLSPARSHLFYDLPEVELPRTFDVKKAHYFIQKIPALRLRTIVEKRLKKILSQ